MYFCHQPHCDMHVISDAKWLPPVVENSIPGDGGSIHNSFALDLW